MAAKQRTCWRTWCTYPQRIGDRIKLGFNKRWHFPQTLPRQLIPKIRPILPLGPKLPPALLGKLERQVELGVSHSWGALGRCRHCNIQMLRWNGARVRTVHRRPTNRLLLQRLYIHFLVHCLCLIIDALFYAQVHVNSTQEPHETGISPSENKPAMS